jgi:hypothetical protein
MPPLTPEQFTAQKAALAQAFNTGFIPNVESYLASLNRLTAQQAPAPTGVQVADSFAWPGLPTPTLQQVSEPEEAESAITEEAVPFGSAGELATRQQRMDDWADQFVIDNVRSPTSAEWHQQFPGAGNAAINQARDRLNRRQPPGMIAEMQSRGTLRPTDEPAITDEAGLNLTGIDSQINRILGGLGDSTNLETDLALLDTLSDLRGVLSQGSQFGEAAGIDRAGILADFLLGSGSLDLGAQELANQLGLGQQGNAIDLLLGTGGLNLRQGEDFTNRILGLGGLGQSQLGTLLNTVLEAEGLRQQQAQNQLMNQLGLGQILAGQQQAAISNPFGAFALQALGQPLFGLPQNLLSGLSGGSQAGLTASGQTLAGQQETSNLTPDQTALINQQAGQDATNSILGFIPSLGDLGFNIPQGATFGGQQPFASFFDTLPTLGQFLNSGSAAQNFLGAIGGATGTPPADIGQILGGVTPNVGSNALGFPRFIPTGLNRGR